MVVAEVASNNKIEDLEIGPEVIEVEVIKEEEAEMIEVPMYPLVSVETFIPQGNADSVIIANLDTNKLDLVEVEEGIDNQKEEEEEVAFNNKTNSQAINKVHKLLLDRSYLFL